MAEHNSEVFVVMTTASSREEAARLADMLVGARLAACVQILPEMASIYHWEGEIRRDQEVLLLAKTTRSKFAMLEREIRALHSYDTPEIIALPAAAVSGSYLGWLTKTLKPATKAAAQTTRKGTRTSSGRQ